MARDQASSNRPYRIVEMTLPGGNNDFRIDHFDQNTVPHSSIESESRFADFFDLDDTVEALLRLAPDQPEIDYNGLSAINYQQGAAIYEN